MSENTSSVLLSSKEKKAIDDILSLAEEEVDQNATYKNVSAIDEQCKKVWPEWSPPKNVVPPISVYKNYQENKSQLNSNNLYQSSFTRQKSSEATLINGSPIKNNLNHNKNKSTEKKFSESELDPQVISQEIESLKNEVQVLMEKINRSIKSPELAPSALKILRKVQSIQIPASSALLQMKKNQMSQRVEIPFKKEVIVSRKDVEKLNINLDKNKQTADNQQNNGQQVQQPKTLFVEQFQLPSKVRTKEQTKSAISQTKKEIRQITQENIALRKQYMEIKKQLKESKVQCKVLENSLARSDAINIRMIKTFGSNAISNDPELVHNF